MKNQTNKRTTRSRTKTLLAATGLALALTAVAPVAGSFEASIEGRAEAQLHRKRQFNFGCFRICIDWCYLGECCAEIPKRPIELIIEGR